MTALAHVLEAPSSAEDLPVGTCIPVIAAPPAAPPRTILLVEDDEDDAVLVQVGLRKVDALINVEVATTAASAIFALRTKQYDAAIVDYRLGASTGLDLIEQSRSTGSTIPMILLTGQGGEQIDTDAMRRGASAYLSKSEMTPQLLERSIRYALARSSNEADLLASKNRYEAAVAGSKDGIWDWNIKTTQLFLSPRFKEMLGFLDAELPSSRAAWFERVHPDDRQNIEWAMREQAAGRSEQISVEYRAQHSNGEWLWFHLRGTLQRDPSGVDIRIAGSQTEITQRKTAEQQIRHQALHDALTGLANRALFADRLEHSMQRVRRESNYGFTLLYLDLDNFKPINDRYGHAAGDIVLMETAARLRDSVREVDTVARMGGDEFVVLLDRCIEAQHAQGVASHLESVLATPLDVPNGVVTPGVSIGIHVVSDGDRTGLEHLAAADRAMYEAKISRRGSPTLTLVTSQSSTRECSAEALERALDSALDAGDVRPHYQPIISACDGVPVGFEALARWNHAEWGEISPAKFVPVAESSGLMGKLGRCMLDQACAWAASRSDAPTISINVSASHLAAVDFVEDVCRALEASGLPADRLIIELTEQTPVVDTDRTLDSLKRLGKLGVQLALDDFGTGYCTVALLGLLPVSTIKLDRSLVADLDTHPNRLHIIRHLAEMAHALGVTVTAEGVETEEEWRALIGQRVDHVQGYYFERPCAEPRSRCN